MPSGDTESADKVPHFDTVLRGYNPRQVNERVTRLTYDLRHASKGRDEAVSKVGELTKSLGSLQQQLLETTTRLNRISANPNSTEGMTERVRLMMELANEEIADFKRQADDYAQGVRAEADTHAAGVRTAADDYANHARGKADNYAANTVRAADDAA